jgi:two-component system, OmpR family, sensor histidine kinase TctE
MIRRRGSEQRSLFGEILDWMLAPLLLLWPLSVGLTWVVAQAIANRPYDRELAAVAEALARQSQVQVAEGSHPAVLRRRELERTLAAYNRGPGDEGDDSDRTRFQVLGSRGELVAGDPRLTVPAYDPQQPGGVRFRDDLIGDEPVRVAWLELRDAQGEGEALVQVAETMGRRSRLATEIIKGVILPQFVILPLAVLLVYFALARGVRPLAELQQTIRRRDSTDLSAIPTDGVPDEVMPLVGAINDLLARLDTSIAAQRHFLADAAHQLKTPLAGLRTQAELAAREIDSGRGDPASMKHSLRQIAVSCQRAARMVNQLLAMARAEDPGQAMRRVPLDLAAVTRAALRDFVPRALERRIDLGYEGPDEGNGPRIVGEPVLLGEVLRNLIDNSLLYTPAGGTVTVRLLADPFGPMQGGFAVLQVEDTGPGVAPAEREAVFRPFYRALGTGVEGSGLGLAIAQEIVQRHGGEITVGDARPRTSDGSVNPPGALFTVRLPMPMPLPASVGAPGP